ncbi:hypothetical protein BV25DRAFT_1914465 [Artomyces pyxidatus]|uniref:Uncharacterized protein n=1 Tax=Artomyces pyxidatus TaxID=48021 RepID=A0ACB8T6B7_9AGAM|nr:hypothetical protein BV25DRAFT_1914465 [Artomyces pyxidatus]
MSQREDQLYLICFAVDEDQVRAWLTLERRQIQEWTHSSLGVVYDPSIPGIWANFWIEATHGNKLTTVVNLDLMLDGRQQYKCLFITGLWAASYDVFDPRKPGAIWPSTSYNAQAQLVYHKLFESDSGALPWVEALPREHISVMWPTRMERPDLLEHWILKEATAAAQGADRDPLEST